MDKLTHIRCRGLILHEGKLLVLRHSETATFFAFPGGHLEWGESPLECVKREIVEELGVPPLIGSILYVNTFTDTMGNHNVEFFYEIKNGEDYLDIKNKERTHANEIYEMLWVDKNHDLRLLPDAINQDFKAGKLISEITREIRSK